MAKSRRKVGYIALVVLILILAWAQRLIPLKPISDCIKIAQNSSESCRLVDENQDPFISRIDTYYYVRLLENRIKNGHYGDTLVNGQAVDLLRDPSRPVEIENIRHQDLMYWLFRLHSTLTGNENPVVAAAWFPVYLFLPVLLALFLIVRMFSSSLWASWVVLFASMVLNGSTRFDFGVPDTDIYQVLFPIWALWGIFQFTYGTTPRRRLLGLVGGAFSCWLYPAFWGAGGYLMLLYFAAVFASLFITHFRWQLVKKHWKWLLPLAILLLGSAIWLILSDSSWIQSLKGNVRTHSLADWKYYFRRRDYIGELASPGISGFIWGIGNVGAIFMAVVALITLVRTKEWKKPAYIFLVILVASGIWGYAKYIRLQHLAFIPMVVLMARAVPTVQELLLKQKHAFFSLLIPILALAMLVEPAVSNWEALRVPPSTIHRKWVDGLKWIDQNASADARLISWWDYGYWYQYYAKRPTLVDGGRFRQAGDYWVGRIFSATNQDSAIYWSRKLQQTPLDLDFRSLEQNDSLFTGEMYLLAGGDMLSKSWIWASCGTWDFPLTEQMESFNNRWENGTPGSQLQKEDSLLLAKVRKWRKTNNLRPIVSRQLQYHTHSWRTCTARPNGHCFYDGGKNGLKLGSLTADSLLISNDSVRVYLRIKKKFEEPMDYIWATASAYKLGTNGLVPLFSRKPIHAKSTFGLVWDEFTNRFIMMHPGLERTLFTQLHFYEGRYWKRFKRVYWGKPKSHRGLAIWKIPNLK